MSTIKLYRSTPTTAGRWKLLASKLFKIENIESFLAEVPSSNITTITDFQYIKTQLEISIKIDNNQIDAEVQTPVSFRYVSVRNTTNGRIAYYFVKKATSRSQKCVQLDLVLDVLNTYTDGVDYIFKSNTKITREHKDRYTRTKSMTCTIDYQVTSSSGSLSEGDRVILTNDRGDDVFIGTLIYIDQYYANIQIENPTSEEDYISRIEPYLGDRFDLSKVDAPANYISFEPSTLDDFYFSTTYKYYRVVDYVSENINPILIRNNDKNIVADSGIRNQNWYLLYRNANDPDPNELVNPVECYLIPEEDTHTDAGIVVNGRLYPSWLEEGKTYVFDLDTGSTIVATLSNGVATSSYPSWYVRLIVTKAGNKINVMMARCWSPGVPANWVINWQYDDIDYIDFNTTPVDYNVYENPTIDFNFLINDTFANQFTNTIGNADIYGIKALDKSDAKNIKCIKLPYCPYTFTYSGDVLNIDGEKWERASFNQPNSNTMYALHLLDSSIKLENILNESVYNPFKNLSVTLTPNEGDLRLNQDDSKMFNSEFYAPTYVYDSFSLKVELETCQLDYYIENGVSTSQIKFTMTSTINSKFMFTLVSYVANKNQQNFYNVMPIARNNEVVLYNVPYINYIRSGYNYDVKNKNIQTGSSWFGVGMSGLSIGASLLAPSVPLKVAGVVGSLVSMALSVKGAITTTMQGEENIKAKLLQAENQTASVKGSDDVDLMSEYCGNRLQYMLYEPTSIMKGLLNDLFFYAGYNSGRMGIPTHNNRINFDYLECDAVLESISANMSDDIINELVNTYKTGVTFIHQSNRDTDKWDIEQKYENWERSLMED